MKPRFLLFSILLFISCRAIAQTNVVDSFQCDGVYRSYRFYVPANFVASAHHPLILNMHGLGSNAQQQQSYSNFMAIADTAQFMMVYPQGLTVQNIAYWNCGIPGFPPVNDIKFLSALIDTMRSRYTIDTQRVFATGMSMGGYMSYYLALHLANRIAAIASVAGTIDPAIFPPSPAPVRAIPVMQVHGTADATVPYSGFANGIQIDTLVQYWVTNNHCTATPVHTNVPDVNTADGCTAEHFVWNNGRNGATVEFYKITGGGHSWPGAANIGVPTDEDFSASAEIWRFFRGYRLSQFLAVNEPAASSLNIKCWPNPCKDVLHLNRKAAIIISDLSGKMMKQYAAAMDFNIATLAPGIYQLQIVGGQTTISFIKN